MGISICLEEEAAIMQLYALVGFLVFASLISFSKSACHPEYGCCYCDSTSNVVVMKGDYKPDCKKGTSCRCDATRVTRYVGHCINNHQLPLPQEDKNPETEPFALQQQYVL